MDKNARYLSVRPAYPHKDKTGMSMRHYLAAQALPAVIQACAPDLMTLPEGQTPEQYFAKRAVACADALLFELSRELTT